MFRKTLKAAVGAFNKVCNLLLGIVRVAMFLVLLLQIISRFIAFVPLPWSQDLIVFLLICSVFLGACTATANNKQIRLEFFVDLLPKKLTKVILIIADLISIAFLVVVTSQAFQMTGENMHVIVGSSPITYGWYYFVVGIGAVGMILNFILLIVDRFADLFAKKGKEEVTA